MNAVSLSRQKNFTTPLIIAGIDYSGMHSFFSTYPEFKTLLDGKNQSRFKNRSTSDGFLIGKNVKDYQYAIEVLEYIAPNYIPDHQAMLDAVQKLQVDP